MESRKSGISSHFFKRNGYRTPSWSHEDLARTTVGRSPRYGLIKRDQPQRPLSIRPMASFRDRVVASSA